jgi:hypothetical protein
LHYCLAFARLSDNKLGGNKEFQRRIALGQCAALSDVAAKATASKSIHVRIRCA